MMAVISNNNKALIFPIVWVIRMMLAIRNIIPIITEMKELALCLTTSVVFSQSNLGYFKLTMIPIKCDISGINIDNTSTIRLYRMFILNFINRIIFPINRIGVVITRQAYIFDIKIVLIFIGSDFKILIFLPSKLMTELVIDVINEVNIRRRRITMDILFVIISFDMPNPPTSSVSVGIILSNLKGTMMTAIINNTSAKPELIIKTGVLKKVFNSFFISDDTCDLALIFNISMFLFLFVITFLVRELILK